MADVQSVIFDDTAAIPDSLRGGLTFEGYEMRTAVDKYIEVGPDGPRLGYVDLDAPVRPRCSGKDSAPALRSTAPAPPQTPPWPGDES
jgi:hypothetical protein